LDSNSVGVGNITILLTKDGRRSKYVQYIHYNLMLEHMSIRTSNYFAKGFITF